MARSDDSEVTGDVAATVSSDRVTGLSADNTIYRAEGLKANRATGKPGQQPVRIAALQIVEALDLLTSALSAGVAPGDLPTWISSSVGQWATVAGTTAPGGVGANFSGVAFRVEYGRIEVFSALPGGHAAGAYVSSNPVYSLRLDTNTLAWQTRRAASDTAGWSPTLPTTEYFPSDSRPIPRHTYNCQHWVPEVNAYMIGGTYAAQNGDLGIIEHRGFRPIEAGGSDDWLARGTFPNKAEFHILVDCRNTLTGKYLVGNSDSSNYYEWNPNVVPPTWSLITPTGTPQTSKGGHAFDYRRNSFTFVGSNGRWWTLGSTFLGYTMNATTWAKTAVTINPSAGYTDFSGYLGVWYHATCRYNENDDAYYLYNGNTFATPSLGGRIYKVFPNETQAWDMLLLPRAGTLPTVETVGSDNRFAILEKYRTAVSVEPGQALFAYRLPFASQIVIRSGAATGALPYTATLLPLRGEVPSGQTVYCPDDATMRASILSTHDDGSAAVIVATGEITVAANTTYRLGVTTQAAGADTPLTTARFAAAGLASVSVFFGSTYGSASLTSFTSPAATWWANSRVICCSYRLPAPAQSGTALEAVIYLTAFAQSSRVLVEVVVENGLIDAAASSGTVKPASATYTGATVSVNGSVVATVNSADAPTGTHQAFRAWYAKGWVGGDPQLRATQRHMDLQRHPLFWRCDKDNTADLSIYASDAYAPWSTGRHPASNMGGGGDVASIGPLCEWDARALQTGDYRCWNAAEANALCGLSFNVNYRDSVTGLVPDSSRMAQKHTKDTDGSGTAGSWPMSTDASTRATWETAHQPAIGLMGFVARPSPVFVEIAQKVAVMTATMNNDPARLALFSSASYGITDMTGITTNQARGFAWGMRNVNHATFLSPDGSSWRSGGRTWLGRIARFGKASSEKAEATLNVYLSPFNFALIGWGDHDGTIPGYSTPEWQNDFLIGEAHRVARTRLIPSGTERTYMDAFADWMATARARFVNEQPDGGWRFVPYSSGYARADFSPFATYLDQRLHDRGGWIPPTVAGQFKGYPQNQTTPSAIDAAGNETAADGTYTSNFWMALTVAVERDVAGARTAWNTVQANLTNLATWRGGFTSRPRWGAWPRNL